MTNVALEKKVRYVLNVGDNIYFTGVSNEHDSRFKVCHLPHVFVATAIFS